MRILKKDNVIVSSQLIEDDGDIYLRRVYSNGIISWDAYSYDGECEEETLEIRYQLLIKKVNKPVETTKEQPKKVEDILKFVEKRINAHMAHNPKIIFLSDLKDFLKKASSYYNICIECGGKCKTPHEICSKCLKNYGGQ